MLSRKPWRMEFVLLFIAAQFLGIIAGGVMFPLLQKFDVAGFRSGTDFGSILLLTLCFQGVTWVLIPIFLKLHEIGWRDAFGLRAPNLGRAVPWTVICFLIILPVSLSLETGLAMLFEKIGLQPQEQDVVKMFSSVPLWPTGVYLGFFAVAIAPVAEEFIFRGMLFPFIKQFRSPMLVQFVRQSGWPRLAWFMRQRAWRLLAWCGVSFLFALVHNDLVTFIPLFVLALALTWLYEKTDCLLAPIAVHSLFNATNLVLLILANEFSRQLPHQP